jgi:hypothetical protein
MKLFLKFVSLSAAVCLLGSAAFSQQPHSGVSSGKTPPGAYNIANDVSLQGTVLKYTENSAAPPIGTHVLVQTPSGNVDVHLGDARLLHLAKLTITPGSNIRFVGQMNTAGSKQIFLPRLVQVGSQVLAVRSERGFLLGPAGVHAAANKALFANATPDKKGVAR